MTNMKCEHLASRGGATGGRADEGTASLRLKNIEKMGIFMQQSY